MAEVEAGKWYVRCRDPECSYEIAIEEADRGQPTIDRRCPLCGTPGRWLPEEVLCGQESARTNPDQ